MKKTRNILLSGLLATTLTACGGGGGGGAIGSVSNFVQEDLSSLSGSESIISSYSSLLSGFNTTISSGNLAGLSAIITGPTEKDITKAGNLLTMLNEAETLWAQTVDLIESQDADTKLQIYNSEDYKNAHAALLYLKNHVKPVIQKVSQGEKLSLTEYNKVASDKKAQEIIEQEKVNTVETYVVDKKTKINEDKQIQIAKKDTKDEETVEQEEKKEQETKKEQEVKEQEETKKEEEVKEEDVKEEEKIVEKQKEVNTDKKEEVKEQKQDEVKEEKQDEVKEEKKEEVKEEEKVVEKEKNIWKTAEFNKDTSKTIINADKAYARGWTGKGAVLGVIDTYQQIDHEALHGKYKWYKDYVLNDTIVKNKGQYQSHGTHVAGIVAGKKDDNEFHGVAFDANLVGANVDYYGNASANMGQAQNALHDFAKLKATKEDGGEAINIIAVNMSFNRTVQFNHYGTITKLDDGTYSSSVVSANKGSSNYWKVGTDNDIVLVNSAGNGMMVDGEVNTEFALDPGIWATEVDSSGNLVLGGKMIIVGNWGGTKEDGQVVGSKSGHVCLDIVDNKCNDKYQVKDFYILAPGNEVYSSVAGDGYSTLSGSSMAAPQVTGALGIIHQMWPHMKGENLVKLVLNTADTNINGYDVNIHGQGMLDLDEATKPQGTVGVPTTGRVDGTVTNLNNTYFATGSASAFSSLSNLKIMVIDDYDRDYYLNLGNGYTVKDKRKYSDVDMLLADNNTYLPINQSFGSFSQGGQYNLINNYNFGFYTGDNGGGDYSLNVGKDFMLDDKLKLKTSIGQMSEQDTWLGNSSDGILSVGDNNNTNFGNIGVEYLLGNNVLSLNYTKGYTDINTTSESIIKDFSDIKTESYRLAYEIHKDTHTTFGWSFSLPSHITSGTMDLEVAESVNLDGTINYANIKSDLAQSTKEKNIGFFYSKTPKHDLDSTVNFTAEYRQHVSGEPGKNGVVLGLNYIKKLTLSCGIPNTGIKLLDKKLGWLKNPKCFNEDGSPKDMKKLYAMQNNKTDNTATHGLVYDLETDKFVPIEPLGAKDK